MLTRYLNLIRGVSVNRIGLIGVVLTTSAFITFLILEAVRLAGFLTNAYVGLVTYLAFPLIFIVGLILIPIGWRLRKKQTGKTTRELLEERFDESETRGGWLGSKLFLTIGTLTILNVIFMGFLSGRMLHFMDEAHFCGTACHKVMNPEWVTYQDSPHARVKCVQCHVGEGISALVNSKLNGIWQIISLTFSLYEQPIPTPVRQLRPARETCEKCHWPEKFYGSRLKSIVHFQQDESSTPLYTTLLLKVDAGDARRRKGIHWHVAPENEVRYMSVADEREEMIWVEMRLDDGSYRRFVNSELNDTLAAGNEVRTIDCVDCHNRATHIYESAEAAVDRRLAAALMDHSLPFIKREGLAAIMVDYPDREMALKGISRHLIGFYQRNYPEIAANRAVEIDSAIAVLQAIYNRNIHPQMRIKWGSYANHIGHENDGGCFRCHNSKLADAEGSNISDDCTSCHSLLAYDSGEPYQFVREPEAGQVDFALHSYLRREFMQSMGGTGALSRYGKLSEPGSADDLE